MNHVWSKTFAARNARIFEGNRRNILLTRAGNFLFTKDRKGCLILIRSFSSFSGVMVYLAFTFEVRRYVFAGMFYVRISSATDGYAPQGFSADG